MLILTNYDFNKNQLLNAVFQNLTTAPAAPLEGQFYYNTTAKELQVYNGASWDPAGAMTAAEIVTLINASVSIIDLDNLPTSVGTAVTNSHTHANKAILDAIQESFTTLLLSKLNGIEAGAQVNDVTSVAGKTGAVSLAKADVGLSNVTNDAQVKKLASSTGGNVPTWNGATGDSLADGYSVETTLTGGASALARADAIKNYIDGLLGANDAMVFKGTLGSGGTITVLPITYSAGWSYRVITAGTYAGVVCEVGDLIIAIVDRAGSGNVNSDWTVIQTNLDGAVIGPASSTDGNFPIFSGITGKQIGNSTYGPSSFAPASHAHGTYDRATSVLSGAVVISDLIVVDGIVTGIATRSLTAADIGASVTGHTHPYTSKYTEAIGGSTSIVVTHNLNSRDLAVTLRESGSPYAQVIADIEFTTVNTITVKFAVAPSAGQYTITVVG